MKPFEFSQLPSPSKLPHEPKDQFCAPGGFQQRITDALQFQTTQLAALQPMLAALVIIDECALEGDIRHNVVAGSFA